MVGVWRWRGGGGGGGGAGLAAFRAAFRAFFRRGGRCPCCAGRRLGLSSSWTRLSCPSLCKTGVFGPDSAARGVPQLQFLDKVLTGPVLRRQVLEGAVLRQGGDMPVVSTTGAWRCRKCSSCGCGRPL